MKRHTKNDDSVGQIDRTVPLSEDPDMIALKELVRKLDPERRERLIEDLVDAAELEEGEKDDAEES
jgi:hypothetical protein